MKFSVIVITYNCDHLTRLTIRSLVQQSYPTECYEVIVVDDGSDSQFCIDNHLVSTINYSCYYLPRTNDSCRARARNFGASKAINDNLIFLDGDQYANSNLIRAYSDFLHQYPENQVVLGTRIELSEWQSSLLIKNASDEQLAKLVSRQVDMREDIRLESERDARNNSNLWIVFWSHNFFISKKLFFEIDGFDENFKGWGCEDVELGYRIARLRKAIKLIDNRVYNIGSNEADFHGKYEDYLKNVLLFFKKYNSIDVMFYFSFYESVFFTSYVFPDSLIKKFREFNDKIKLYGAQDLPL